MTDTDDGATLRPVALDDYVGQERMKDTINVLIARARADDVPLPNLLLTGPPGCGKTTLAMVLASQTGVPLHVVRQPPTPEQFMRILLRHGDGIIQLDELQEWPTRLQGKLLSLLDEERIFEAGNDAYRFPYLTVVGTTTDEHKLRAALVNRFIVPPFDDYTDDELADIVAGMGVKLGVILEDPMCEALGRACGGVPRMAKHLVNQAISLRVDRGRMPSVEELLDFVQVTAEGLTRRHMDYLRALDSLDGEGGIANIARMMPAPEEIAVQAERLLIRQGLIRLGRNGRMLTVEGTRRIRPNTTRPTAMRVA